MKINQIKTLKVFYNNREVGIIHEIEKSTFSFEYSESWIKDGFSISPFQLPLIKKIFISPKKTFDGLFGVFHDSLPDGWGEKITEKKLRNLGIEYDSLSPLTKLSLIGENSLGGLTYKPSQFRSIPTSTQQNFEKLYEEINKILKDKDKYNIDSLYELCGSSGGARPKAHILIKNEPWIIKFKHLYEPLDSGAKEFKVNKAAKKCNIELPEFKLIPSKKYHGFFACKRFDVMGKKKIHVISLSGLLEVSHKEPILDYLHLFQVIDKIVIKNKKEQFKEAFKRMCFNYIFMNKDDHAKNFSFIFDEGIKSYKLSPAYDLTITKNKLFHEMTFNQLENPKDKDLIKIGTMYGLTTKECLECLRKIQNIKNKFNT